MNIFCVRALAIMTITAGCSLFNDCAPAESAVYRNVPYAEIQGTEPNLLSLDIYLPEDKPMRPMPVVLWVHGGGWSVGDKSNGMSHKPALFNRAGYCFVSINYRLSPLPPPVDPHRIMHPTHAQDVAAAISWVHANIHRYGGDPKRLALMGHSAGAHLVAIVATDETYLGARGLSPALLSGIASLDTEGYDVAATLRRNPNNQIYLNAFGADPNMWAAASPLTHCAPGKPIPPFFLVTRGRPERRRMSEDFAAALRQAGARADIVDASPYTHAEVNRKIGTLGEKIVTPPLMAFFADVFAQGESTRMERHIRQ